MTDSEAQNREAGEWRRLSPCGRRRAPQWRAGAARAWGDDRRSEEASPRGSEPRGTPAGSPGGGGGGTRRAVQAASVATGDARSRDTRVAR